MVNLQFTSKHSDRFGHLSKSYFAKNAILVKKRLINSVKPPCGDAIRVNNKW